MARAENEALVRHIFAAFAQKRGFALRNVFADDATWVVPGSGSMAGTFVGREQIFAFLGRLPKETDGTYSSSLIDVLASDDRAAALYRASGERQRPAARARPGAAVPDRGRARAGGARAAERPGRVRHVLGLMTAELDFTRFDAITFDCYGTLIDWEQGILNALQPVLAPHGVDASEDELLERYARHEAALEAGDVPAATVRSWRARCAGSCEELGFSASDEDADGFAQAIGDWPAFHDTAPALRRLHERFKLGVITNCDRDLFALSNRRLGVTFDWVVTAEDARAYKPSLAPFERAFETIDVPARPHPARGPEPLPRPRARQAARPDDGLGRPPPRPGGFGATPAASATPDLTVPDMRRSPMLRSARRPTSAGARPGGRAPARPGRGCACGRSVRVPGRARLRLRRFGRRRAAPRRGRRARRPASSTRRCVPVIATASRASRLRLACVGRGWASTSACTCRQSACVRDVLSVAELAAEPRERLGLVVAAEHAERAAEQRRVGREEADAVRAPRARSQ